MNIQVVATKLIDLINDRPVSVIEEWEAKTLPESLTFFHVCEMLKKIENADVEGEQAHRWLGWVQCALVSNDIGCLTIMKQINHNA